MDLNETLRLIAQELEASNERLRLALNKLEPGLGDHITSTSGPIDPPTGQVDSAEHRPLSLRVRLDLKMEQSRLADR